MTSSAKCRTLDVTTFGMSLIYNKNNRGPITVPCGTPDIAGTSVDISPSRRNSLVSSCQGFDPF